MKLLNFSIILLFVLRISYSEATPLYNKPIYNPGTKSYFELYSPGAENLPPEHVLTFGTIRWVDANRMARKRSYRGVRGRLAVVKDRATHEFLKAKFKAKGATWIGLRYFCVYKKFLWSTGEIFRPGKDFSIWGPYRWNDAGGQPTGEGPLQCGGHLLFFPVHYWGLEYGFLWNANGQEKGFNSMFIEYPTGKP